MAKRKATKRTQRKARGKGKARVNQGVMTVDLEFPGVTLTLNDGTTIYHGPLRKASS
ncbi:MAG: hypothetical protein KR126chlam3_01552 [Chlamydiae bacterium]|nr:hypothetical protein [Chlamydiota bacterium]